MHKARKQPGIRNIEFSSSKSLTHFEQLEPRIMLSADGLLNVMGPASSPNTSMESLQQVIECSELSQTNDQLEEQAYTESSDAGDYQPILTLRVDDSDNEESAEAELSVSNVESAQVEYDISALWDDFNTDQKSFNENEDGNIPTYINNADLSKEYATSIEIRGPPANEAITLSGMHLVEPTAYNFNGQVVYLDFNGEDNVTYNGPVIVDDINVPEFTAQ